MPHVARVVSFDLTFGLQRREYFWSSSIWRGYTPRYSCFVRPDITDARTRGSYANRKTSQLIAIERGRLATQREHRALAPQTLELVLAMQVEGQTRAIEQVVGGR